MKFQLHLTLYRGRKGPWSPCNKNGSSIRFVYTSVFCRAIHLILCVNIFKQTLFLSVAFLLGEIVFIKGPNENGVVCKRFNKLQSKLMKCEFVSIIKHPKQ